MLFAGGRRKNLFFAQTKFFGRKGKLWRGREKKTAQKKKLFLRKGDFWGQEANTANETKKEPRKETMRVLDIYAHFVEQFLAMPVIVGQKTPSERFAGAVDTYSIEAMMKDGRAVQAGTSHYLGNKFAVAFDIKYLDRENTQQFVHTTSWGVSTRLLGALIMVHGDDRGLALPPKVAPTQVIMIPIGPPKTREQVIGRVDELYAELKKAGVRVKVDDRADQSPGWKFNEYEMRGVPIRVELGPRDMENGQVVLVSRVSGEKKTVQQTDFVQEVLNLLAEIHQQMYDKAKQFRDDHYIAVDSIDEFKTFLET